MFNKKVIIVTPWLGAFAGGAESLAKGMARELNVRGIKTAVFTTCSLSPYDNWWEDAYEAGSYDIAGIEVHRFRTNKSRARYQEVIAKLQADSTLTPDDKQAFFDYGINSTELVDALAAVVDDDHEIVAVPYFHGLTHSVINTYAGKISLIPCFHDEQQFYWAPTEKLLARAKHIFYNSPEEKEMTIRQYGAVLGRKLVEAAVAGVGVELPKFNDDKDMSQLSLPASYFVYAGRKEPGKNVPLLGEWFIEHTQRSHCGAKLVFIGGGDESLLPRTDPFIHLGFVSEADKRRVISGSKGIINLSNNESFSIVIMEGWLLGVPAIVSAACPVMKGHVRRSNGGLYVSSSEEFSAALDYLERNDARRVQLATNGRQYVARDFSYDAVLARYLRAFAASDAQPEYAIAC